LENTIVNVILRYYTKKIKEGVESVLKGDINKCKIGLPGHFEMELSFRNHGRAYKASFYPGIKQVSSTNLVFESDNYFEVLRMLLFVT